MAVSDSQPGFIRKNLVLLFLIVFGYLFEVCVMPYLQILDFFSAYVSYQYILLQFLLKHIELLVFLYLTTSEY